MKWSPGPPSGRLPQVRARRRGLLELAGVLEAGGYAVDGEQEEAFEALAFVVLGVRVAQGGQGAELEVGQGVHVGVAERDGAGEYVPVGQQAVVARHGEDEAPGAVVL